MVRIKSSQKIFTEEEATTLTGICREHILGLARNKHLGSLASAAGAVGVEAQKLLFTTSDLLIMAVLHPRCQH